MHKYLFRGAVRRKKGWRQPSAYHLIAPDGKRSKCGAVEDDVMGYGIVEKEKALLSARLCSNCLNSQFIDHEVKNPGK